ncbi:MAG TPA: alpha/beta fold hydrolase [Pirellulales bacterium]|nr:alpha/beta fold hydrolase [Pirellulales bacterium]
MTAIRRSWIFPAIFALCAGLAGCHLFRLAAAEPDEPGKKSEAEPAKPADQQPAKPADQEPEKPADQAADAREGVPPEARRRLGGRLTDWRTKTLGGKQLWDDELLFQNWRIQRSALVGHCRLLDGDDRREARGSFEQCQEQLEEIKRERKLAPMKGTAVIILHGLGGTRSTMRSLATYIEEKGGYTVLVVGYASTRSDIAAHARRLAGIVEHLDGIDEIHFVAHSLGNLIVRRYLGDSSRSETGGRPDPRIKRFVMIAPPNHGAAAAEAWSDGELFSLVLGKSAVELGSGWPDVEKTLATPTCEFGVIAGGKGDDRGYNSRLEGDNDGLLSVATTRLVGARDFVVVPVLHPFSTMNAKVQEYTLRFLQEGYFISADERHPITDSP